MSINLTDDDLFGNDAAEDESDEVFNGYALIRPELKSFLSPLNPIKIIHGYKGEGKSAVLRLVKTQIPEGAIVAAISAPSISPTITSWDADAWVREWKKALLNQIAVEVGSQIGMAWSDDATVLVEEAEKAGFKARSLVGYITDRIKANDINRERPASGAQVEKALARFSLSKKQKIFLVVDDVDQNFKNSKDYKAKVTGFFLACRQIVGACPEIRVRAAIRPNVWKTIKREFEALSHVQQYIVPVSWTVTEMRKLLSRRIEGYLERHGHLGMIPAKEIPEAQREEDIIALVFNDQMKWGSSTRPPHVIINTLSRSRPRWMVELSRAAASSAAHGHHSRIRLEDIVDNLENFGKRRIDDTIAEFSSQCPEVEELIAAFSHAQKEYTTQELVDLIKKKISDHLTPRIEGVVGKPNHLDIAAFLFEIGFLSARRDRPDGTYEHVSFSDEPTLLRSRSNPVDGVTWEIHPVFAEGLGLHGHKSSRKVTR